MIKYNTITFTGKRPKDLFGYTDVGSYVEMMKYIYNIVKDFHLNKGTNTFITGAAQGFDQLVFRAVNKLKKDYPNDNIKNILYVPCKNQDSKWLEDGSIFSRKEYRKLLNIADEIKYISEEYTASCLEDRNKEMVKDADMLIALYPDDTWLTTKGSGTANCMNDAKNKGIDIYQISYDKENILNTLELKKVTYKTRVNNNPYNPLEDGITHLNVYSKANTELGKFCTNFAYCPIETKDGKFNSIEGYWGWLGISESNPKREEFRNLYGIQAKRFKEELFKAGDEGRFDNDFEDKIRFAIHNKFQSEKCKILLNKLEANNQLNLLNLPICHYYYYGNIDNPKVVDVTDKYSFFVNIIRDEIKGLREQIKDVEYSNDSQELDGI